MRYSKLVVGVTFFVVAFSFLSQYSLYEELLAVGTFSNTENCETRLVTSCYNFTPFSEDFIFSYESVAYFYNSVYTTVLFLGGAIGFLGGLGLWLLIRGRKIKKKLDTIMSNYIRQAYLVNFETVMPKGKTKQQKFFNIALTVFPELKEKYDMTRKKGKKYEYDKKKKIGKYYFDLLFDTSEGKTGVMFFESLTFEELKKFIDNVKTHFDHEGDRIICVSKKYDEFFETKEFEDRLNKKNRQFNLDLILEEELGYSILWID